jgi:hypothetical protein
MSQAIKRATNLLVLSANLYRELAISAFSLVPRER